MRIQLILILIFISFNSFGSDDQEMKELFKKYDQVMDHKKVELIDEVFTKNFIKTSGGKEELILKIKELPLVSEKNLPKTTLQWRKGQKDELYFATIKEISSDKNKTQEDGSQFIVLKEEGKLKINGTLGDAN